MKTFQSSILRGLLFAVALLPFILASQSAAGQYIPRAYWRFESPADTLDASGNGHNININPTWITTDNLNPIAGNYLTIDLNDPLPGVGGINEVDSIGEMRQEFTVEFWFRAAKDFYTGRFQWFNKMEAHFEESRILFLVRLNANMTDTLLLNLNGVGTSGANTVYDGDWHHYVFQYSAKSGEQRLYIDGNSPQDLGYSIVHGASSGVRDGGVLWFSQPGGGYRLSGHLDEFAIFDTLIPPTLVWQHYLQGLSGSAYTFVDTVTVRPEFPQAIAQQEVNELEFGPGYPNVSDSVISLLRAYPLPRYLPNQDFRRLVPWLSDPDSLVDGTSIASRGPEMVKLIEELEENWNYYLYSGVLKSNFGYRRYLDSNNIAFNVNIKEYYLVQMLNDSSNFGKPRFMISNWPQLEPRHLLPEKIPFAYINYDTINTSWAPSLPDDFFIRDGQGNPKPLAFGKQRKNFAMANPLYLNDYRLHDSIRFDGLVNRWYVERFFSLIDSTQHYIDLIGENDETQAIYSWSAIREDAEIRLDMDTNGYDTLTQERIYQAERLNTMREVFRDPFRNFIDSLNAAAGREDLEFWWYELRGGGDGNDTLFPVQKPIVAYRDGFQRSGPYLYPNLPLRWRSGGGEFKGLRELVESRYWELMDEENLFLPALSPGFCHFSYQVADRDMMRPAQFLAYLKGIAMLGADSYALFTYHDSPIHPTRARWRTWKMPMLAYAQAISSRISDYLYSGQVLLGDVFSSAVGVGPSRYTFNTGNLNDFVSGRQLTGQNRFVVSGSIQRRSNAIAAAPRAKDVCIQLSDTASTVVIPELQFEIRTQGSTYLLDLSGPAPVFYQLDKWHEAKDPWHWCRDFAFEAEVFDSATGVSNFTERPGTPAAGDYREFTSYVEVPPTSGLLRYHFTPRHSEQDSLFLWVRARGSADSLTAIIGGTTVTLANFPTNNFDWVGSVTPIPTPVHTEQIAELRVYGDTLDLDQVVFKRSGDDFTAQSFSVSISADTLVCFGDTTNFYNASGAPSGCVDYFWDFGDGTFAYAAQPGHVYNYP
ncbi:MAG: LamG-like jellyroll fold domain-containing protein, partial [Bacteroidota bacterium]